MSYVIDCLADGATLGAGTVNAGGINLGTNNTGVTGFGSLWYVLPTGSANPSQPGQFRVVQYLSTTETPAPNWVLICVAFTDAGQQVIRWQAGSIVLPIPDAGNQIQWGSTLQQLGRGANKLSLDGATGNANVPGALTVGTGTGVLTLGGSLTSGHVVGVSADHAIILRGDTTNPSMNYSITPGDTCCFIEYGGRWVFRRINPGLNENLFEINPTNVFYKSVALERTPWISALALASGAVVNNRGQRVATCSKGTPAPIAGEHNIFWQAFDHPNGMNYIVHATPAFGEAFVYVSTRQSDQVRLIVSTRSGSPIDNAFFITIY